MALLISHGDKGGVGKSFIAKALIDYCVRNERPVLPIDTDTRNADVFQVTNATMEAARVNLREEDGWADLVDLIQREKDSRNIVVSLPAGIGDADDLYGNTFSAAIDEVGLKAIVFWVINAEQESVKLLKHMMDQGVYSPKRVIVVKNHHFATRNNAVGLGEGFETWQRSKTRAAFLEAGGREINFPSLRRSIAQNLDQAQVLFSQLPNLRVYDRIVLSRWMAAVDDAFASLQLDLL